MENKKLVENYLKKYFKTQYFKETDDEFKALLNLLNKKDKKDKVVKKCKNCNSDKIITENIYRCEDCNCFHNKNGEHI